jgi:hypothetical protein
VFKSGLPDALLFPKTPNKPDDPLAPKILPLLASSVLFWAVVALFVFGNRLTELAIPDVRGAGVAVGLPVFVCVVGAAVGPDALLNAGKLVTNPSFLG